MKIDRAELYRRVWEQPITKLAKELDISDVGLSKICRKHQIPVPPVGHWVKVKHGKGVMRPPLPEMEPVTINIDAERYRPRTPERLSPEKLPVIAVQSGLVSGPHTRATMKKLQATPRSEKDFATAYAAEFFDCSVSKAAVEPAMKLLDAIERALPDIGAKLGKGEKCLEVEYEGERISFRLREQYTRNEHVILDKYGKGWNAKEYSYNFTGKFALEITSYFSGRKRWADGVRENLTLKLGEFVQGVVEAALAIKRRRLELEEQQRQWAEAARLREQEEQRRHRMKAPWCSRILIASENS